MIESLALKSYRGGYKVGVIEGAETLNANGANAFLKTLEEPTADTVLMLIARPSHRLPATIASRCLRLTLRLRAADAAIAWLEEQTSESGAAGSAGGGSVGDARWDAALALAGGAPLLALELDAAGDCGARCGHAGGVCGSWRTGSVDVTLLAERWLQIQSGAAHHLA